MQRHRNNVALNIGEPTTSAVVRPYTVESLAFTMTWMQSDRYALCTGLVTVYYPS
jgi:hypothetical protein